MAALGTPGGTIEILKKYNFSFQKKYGQNFLIDANILEKIVNASDITDRDCVLEIGPGIGTMTQYLAKNAKEVIAVEIDQALIPILKDTLAEYNNVTVINEDILKLDIGRIVEEKNGEGRKSSGEPSLLYYDTDYYGPVGRTCPHREHHHHGAKRSSRKDADRARNQRLWSAVAGGAILYKTGNSGASGAYLFYAETEGGKYGDPPGQVQRTAG